MPLLDYNTNQPVQGLQGLKLYEGDPDYDKKKMYQDAGYSWKELAAENGELAYKWAAELAANNPFRDYRTPVSDQEVLNVINTMDAPDREQRKMSVPEFLEWAHNTGDYESAKELTHAQETANAVGYGESKYDTEQDLTVAELENLQDVRSVKQSNAAKWGVSALKAATLAGTTYLDGTLGFIFGAGSAIANGDANKLNANAVSDALQGFNNWMEEVAPVYKSKYSEETPWYQNLTSVDLWADGILKNMGFTVGALWSGSTATKALREIPKVAQSMKAQEALGSIYSAVSEGRIEANQTYHDLLDNQTAQINKAFQEHLKSIENDPDYETKAQEALEQRNQMLKEAEGRAATAGLQTLAANTVLLSGTNFSTWGRMFSKDFNVNKRLLFDGTHYTWKDKTKLGVAGNIIKDFSVEGNEEMAQQTFSTWAKFNNSIEDPDYYNKAFMDANTEAKTVDGLEALNEAFIKTYANPDEWEQFFAGAMTSLMGIPMVGRRNNSNNESLFKGKPVSIQGGIIGEFLARSRDNAEGREAIAKLNEAVDKIQKQGTYFTRQAKLLDDMEGYLAEDDRFSYENTQDGLDFNTFTVFRQTGRLDDLKQILGKDFENMSDEDLTELVNDFPEAFRNTDGTLKSDTEEGRNQIRQELIANQKKMFERLDAFEKSFEEIQKFMPQLNDDEVTDLAWYYWKQKIFDERFKDVKENNKDGIKQILETVNNVIDKNENKFKNAISPAIKEQTKKLKVLQPFLRRLAEGKHIQNVFTSVDEKGQVYTSKLTTQALEYMLGNKSLLNNSGMDVVSYRKTINAINDINRMAASVESFQNRLEKYLKHPEELEQERQKEEQKNQEKTEVTNKINTEADIIKKPLSTLVQMDLDGQFNIDDTLKSAGASSESAKHLAKAKALRSAYIKKLDEAKQKLKDPAQYNAYKKALQNTLKTATKPEDLNNVSATQSESLDDSVEEVMAAVEKNEALEKALMNLDSEVLEASAPNRTDEAVENMSAEVLEGETPSGKDGQPQIPAVNLEQGLNEESTPNSVPDIDESEEDTFDEIFTRAARKAVYNLIWVNDGIMPLEKLAKALSDNFLFTGMSLPNVMEEIKDDYEKAVKAKTAIVEDLYTDIMQKVYSDSKPFDNKENFMRLLIALSNDVKESVKAGENNPSIIISKLDNKYAPLNNFKDAKDNSLSVYVDYLVNSTNNETPSVEIEKPIEEVISEQRVKLDEQPVNNRQESVVTEDEKPSNTQKENNKNTYWRPNVAELPFGDLFNEDKRNYTPLWQRIDDLINKGKDAVKAGIARVFGNNEALAIRSRAIGKYLNEHGAYQRANNDEIKVGDDVYFKIDSSLNRDANDFVVLMVNDKNEVIGDLPALGDNGVNNAIHLKSFVEEIKRQYEEAGSPETWNVPKTYKTKVTELMRGKAPYNNERNSLKDVFGDLLKTASFHVHPVSKLPSISMDIMGKSMSFTFITPYLNEDTRNKNLGKHISILLKKAFRAKNNDDRMQYIRQINSLIADDVVVYSEPDGSITAAFITQDGTRHNIFKNLTIDDNNINDVLDFVWEQLYGNQVIIRDDFKTDFADDLFINLPKDMKLVGSWFTVAPITENGDMIQPSSVKDAKASYLPTTPNRRAGNATITVQGNSYNIDLESWGVTDSKGKALAPSMDENDPIRQALAKAVVVKNGWDLSKPQQTMWGMYNPSNASTTTQQSATTELKRTEDEIEKLKRRIDETRDEIVNTLEYYKRNPLFEFYSFTNKEGKTGTIYAYTTKDSYGREKWAFSINNESAIEISNTAIKEQGVQKALKHLYDNVQKITPGEYVRLAYPSLKKRLTSLIEELSKVQSSLLTEQNPAQKAVEILNQGRTPTINNATVVQNTAAQAVAQPSQQTDKFGSITQLRSEHPELSKCTPTMFQKYQNLSKEEAVKKIKRDLNNKNKNILLRESASNNDNGVTDAEKQWFEKAFPQFSDKDRLRIVENLQFKGVKAWGMFKNGVITLANKAASGTLYHEAFHAVTHCLLTTDEKFDMFSEAQKKYGNHLNKVELEENLAEDFRRYMQFSEMPFVGKLVKLFRNLKHWVKTLAGNESAIDKLMYEIASGNLRNREILNYKDVAPTERIHDIQNRVFEKTGIGLGKNNPNAFHTDSNSVYRITGQSQIDDIINSGYVRPKEGKIRGGRSNEVHWARGEENLLYTDINRYILETNKNINGSTDALSINDLQAIWKFEDGKWINIIDEVKNEYNSNREDDTYFRYIDFSSINGVQEHLDRTINNMQGRTKQAMINEWAKIADVWRAAGINVKAVFQKIGRNPGRMVVKKIEMFNTRNYMTPSRYSYSTLNDEERDIIASKNMTPQEYDSLPNENKNLIWKCAKLGY